MAGILDDADRDATSHQSGAIRDVALTGAIRKAKAAEIVSLDTAIALADAPMADMLKALRHEAIATDHQLRGLLEELTN
jgi:ferritin-like metal-binding protein YciE